MEQHLWWIPGALLLAVALHQRWRVHSVGQSAWKGGGFGMFSDLHHNSIAAVLWTRNEAGLEVALRIDPTVSRSLMSRIPTSGNILRWGREIMRGRWQRCGGLACVQPLYSTERPVTIARVTLQHLWITFDGRRGVYTAEERGTWELPAVDRGR
jgi:hypothetical protein